MMLTLENLSGQRTLLDELRHLGISVAAPCGGRGVCGRCTLTVNGAECMACTTKVSGTAEIVLPAEEWERIEGVYDLAVDLGTTNLVAQLLRPSDGMVVAEYSAPNAQRAFGADVVTRIQHCREGGSDELTRLIREQIGSICDYRKLSIAGNTVMECIYAGIDPYPIAVPPFTAPELFEEDAVLLPCVSGYIGGDVTAGLTAVGGNALEGNCLYIDFGTNGEIALGNASGYLTCATAAGPAFECCGTLYGSEVVDAIARMLREGTIGKSGRLSGSCAFSQQQIRELQLAKSAVRSGIEVLLETAGLTAADLDRVIVAGKFGEVLNPDNAFRIGLLPECPGAEIVRAGNASLRGAVLALGDEGRGQVRRLTAKCEYLELSLSEDFSRRFVTNLNFG